MSATFLTEAQKGILARVIVDAVESGTDLRTVAEALDVTLHQGAEANRLAAASEILNDAVAAGTPYAAILAAFALE